MPDGCGYFTAASMPPGCRWHAERLQKLRKIAKAAAVFVLNSEKDGKSFAERGLSPDGRAAFEEMGALLLDYEATMQDSILP